MESSGNLAALKEVTINSSWMKFTRERVGPSGRYLSFSSVSLALPVLICQDGVGGLLSPLRDVVHLLREP